MEWAFAICILYCISDINTVTNSGTGLPLIEVYYLATGSKATATMFIVAIAIVIFVALFNVFASVSRLTWAFARDHGLPFSRTFAKVS
jgi:amino acid transporter